MEIRDAKEADAAVIARLLGELDYPTAPAALPPRLERLAAEAGAGVLAAVESRARERGCDRLEVTTKPKREAALALYVAAGYAEKPRRLLRSLAR